MVYYYSEEPLALVYGSGCEMRDLDRKLEGIISAGASLRPSIGFGVSTNFGLQDKY